jgi:hypothetical protein
MHAGLFAAECTASCVCAYVCVYVCVCVCVCVCTLQEVLGIPEAAAAPPPQAQQSACASPAMRWHARARNVATSAPVEQHPSASSACGLNYTSV